MASRTNGGSSGDGRLADGWDGRDGRDDSPAGEIVPLPLEVDSGRALRRACVGEEPCEACGGAGVARFIGRELEALLDRQRAHLPQDARLQLELLRDAIEELAPAPEGRIVHVAWDAPSRRVA